MFNTYCVKGILLGYKEINYRCKLNVPKKKRKNSQSGKNQNNLKIADLLKKIKTQIHAIIIFCNQLLKYLLMISKLA